MRVKETFIIDSDNPDWMSVFKVFIKESKVNPFGYLYQVINCIRENEELLRGYVSYREVKWRLMNGEKQ